MNTDWLLKSEPDFYKDKTGSDPYAIWVTKLNGFEILKLPARLLAFTNNEQTKASVIYMDGSREEILAEQMTARDA